MSAHCHDKAQHTNLSVYQIQGHRYTLVQLPKSPTTVLEIEEVSSAIVEVVTRLNHLLNNICHSICLLQINTASVWEGIIDQVMNNVILAFLSCIGIFDRVCATILGRDKKSAMIYSISKFVLINLHLLHSLVIRQTSEEQITEQKSPENIEAPTERKEYVANKQLSRTLCTIFYNIAWSPQNQAHAELLEGMLYSLLHGTGRLLSLVFFDEVVTDLDRNTPHDSVDTERIHESELHYVVQILRNAMGGSDRRDLIIEVLKSNQMRKTGIQHNDRLKTHSMPGLLGIVKERLENTLLRNTVSDIAGEGFDTPPEFLEDEEATSPRNEGELRNWFAVQIYDTLGLDLVT